MKYFRFFAFLLRKNRYRLIFLCVLLVICTVIVNVEFAQLFRNFKYLRDIGHFADKNAYALMYIGDTDSPYTVTEEEILSVPGISSVVSCNAAGKPITNYFYEYADRISSSLRMNVVYCAGGYLNEAGITLLSGRLPNPQPDGDGVYETLVSESLSEYFPKGTECNVSQLGEILRIRVVGVVKSDSYFMLLSGYGNANSLFRKISDGDYYLFIPISNTGMQSIVKIFTVDESLSESERDDLLTYIRTNYGTVDSFHDIYENLNTSIREDFAEHLPLSLLLICICVFSVYGCTSIFAISNLGSFSILYLVGASGRTCSGFIILMNFTTLLLSGLLSVPALSIYISSVEQINHNMYFSDINVILSCLIFVLIFILSSIVPLRTFRKSAMEIYISVEK